MADVAKIVEQLRLASECPMWADHAEVRKDLLAAAVVAFERLLEDRARFPEKPDGIGRMIGAHISNLKAGKEAAHAHAKRAFDKLDVMREALKPFADAAESYDPDEGDGAHIAWAHDFTIASLRRAREARR
ncbi:hypothetical protein [EBPR siphovirus 2]|nr:hypothetical protein [EBPR siphovirus 2]